LELEVNVDALTLNLTEIVTIASLFSGMFLYIAGLKERLAKCEWRIAVMEKDINASREIVKNDVIGRFGKDFEQIKETLYHHETLLKNLQIRCNAIESYLSETQGYRPTDTNTNMDRR
jgi:hypothetical protein